MSKALLVICGPTATGKTSLGIECARAFNGEIISADSRQVYIDMTVGTGKEYSVDVPIWGYDLVTPEEEFSVSHFQSFANEKIIDIRDRHKLPILVGGTGLYIRSIIGDISTTNIPPNESLRKELQNKSSDELFKILVKVNPQKAESLNNSDKNNPRRIIRAIEIEKAEIQPKKFNPLYNTLTIGLTSDIHFLEERLKHSIEKRIQNDFESEVTHVFSTYKKITSQAKTATGYKEMEQYLSGLISFESMKSEWFLSERQYVKRQLTWFNKSKDIHWFDISTNFKPRVAELVKTWHNSVCHEK